MKISNQTGNQSSSLLVGSVARSRPSNNSYVDSIQAMTAAHVVYGCLYCKQMASATATSVTAPATAPSGRCVRRYREEKRRKIQGSERRNVTTVVYYVTVIIAMQ